MVNKRNWDEHVSELYEQYLEDVENSAYEGPPPMSFDEFSYEYEQDLILLEADRKIAERKEGW